MPVEAATQVAAEVSARKMLDATQTKRKNKPQDESTREIL